MSVRWPRISFYLSILFVLLLDQLTKAWAVAAFKFPGDTVPLIPGFFSLTFVQNRGIAFGMFAGQGLLVGLVVIALGLVAIYYSRGINWAGWEPNLVGGALCGGALGNLIDRARQSYVIDFFDVHIRAWNLYWPVFNIADSFICIAVAWIVYRQLFEKK